MCANRLIAKNPEGSVPMVAMKSGAEPEVLDWQPDYAVKFFLDTLYEKSDTAVLCRTNREVQSITSKLEAAGIKTYRPEPPKDNDIITSIIKFADNPTSEIAWSNLSRSISFDLKVNLHYSIELAVERMLGHLDERIRNIGTAIAAARKPHPIVGEILEKISTVFPESQLQWWVNNHKGSELRKAINDRSLLDIQNPEQGDRVAVLTVHQSKGLEWPLVIVAGVDEGNFPNKISTYKNDDLEEERRVFYVAITRAIEKLIVLYSSKPSQFVMEAFGNVIDNQRRVPLTIEALSEEERRDLESSIIQAGRVLDKIKIWRGQIVDGHNRYEIANDHGLPFDTEEIEAESEQEVLEWIITNQNGRRNNDLTERRRLIAYWDAIVNATVPDMPQRANRAERVKEAAGLDLSERQVARELEVIDEIKELPQKARRKIESGEVAASSRAIRELKELPEEQREQVIDLIEHAQEGATAIATVTDAIDLVKKHHKSNDREKANDYKIQRDAKDVNGMLARIANAIDDRANHYKDKALGHRDICQAALNEFNLRWQEWIAVHQ